METSTALTDTSQAVAINAAKHAIRARQAALRERFEFLKAAVAARKRELEASEAHHAKITRALRAANTVAAGLTKELRAGEMAAALEAIESATNDEGISLEPFMESQQVRARLDLAHGLIKSLAEFFVPEALELTLVARRTWLLARADECDALADERAFQREIALSRAVAFEGQLVVDEAKTVSGEIRHQAARLRNEAEAILLNISDMQKKRKVLPI